MEKTAQLAFCVTNCFQSPNQKQGGLYAHGAVGGRANTVQELPKRMMT
jgi:hypothetical protein